MSKKTIIYFLTSVIYTPMLMAKEIYTDSQIFMNKGEEYVFTHYILYVILGFVILGVGFYIASKTIMRMSTKDKLLALHLHEVMEQSKLMVEKNDSLSETLNLLNREKKEYAVVVGAMRRLEGVILKIDLDKWLAESVNKGSNDSSKHLAHSVRDLMISPPKLGPYDKFSTALHVFVKDKAELIAVVDTDGRLVGIVNKELILSTVDRLLFIQTNTVKN